MWVGLIDWPIEITPSAERAFYTPRWDVPVSPTPAHSHLTVALDARTAELCEGCNRRLTVDDDGMAVEVARDEA